MSQLTIREASLEDSSEIFRLFKEFAVLEGIADGFKGTIESFRCDGFGNERRFSCIVAEDKTETETAKIIGFVQYTWIYYSWRGRYEMHIDVFSVVENKRRQGVGTALFQKAVMTAQEKGIICIQLITRKDNTAAINFYNKLGAMNVLQDMDWNNVKVFESSVKLKAEQIKKRSKLTPEVAHSSQPSSCRVKSAITVRDACVEDCEELFKLVQELVVYEHVTDEFTLDFETFKSHGFGDKKHFHCVVVEEMDSSQSGRHALIGYLIYTWKYKIWQGCDIMYVEDLYVAEKSRGRSIGTALFEKAIQTAAVKGCSYIQLTVRKDNVAAMNFYKKFDAVNISEEKGMQFLMFDNICK